MFRQGSKALAVPAIKIATSIRPTSWVALSKLTNEAQSTGHRKLSSSRRQRRSSMIGRNRINNLRMASNQARAQTRTLNLQEARGSVDDILSRLSKLDPPLSSFSNRTSSVGRDEKKKFWKLRQDTKEFFASLIASVDKGVLNPSGKHGKELSNFLELVLFAYSRLIHVPQNNSIFDDCQKVLDTLKKWNLNIRGQHYEYCIEAANREQRWKEAANLFWRQIDPEAGYNPVRVRISKPHGLYAIALCAQEENSAVAEHVFDAVGQLTMVSPADQRTCKYSLIYFCRELFQGTNNDSIFWYCQTIYMCPDVLAAGTALGHAGEWKSALEYLETSFAASQLGQVSDGAVVAIYISFASWGMCILNCLR